jgi:tetratricopeptide (TPR) repeat protein
MRGFSKIGVVSALIGGMLVATASVSSGQTLNDADALNKKVIELYNAGKYADAIPLAQRLLAIREKAFGGDHPDLASPLNNPAALYSAQGRYADAEPLVKRSLAIREKALGSDSLTLAPTLTNLAWLYYHQGRYAESEPLHKRALAIIENTLGHDHPNVAVSLTTLPYYTKSKVAMSMSSCFLSGPWQSMKRHLVSMIQKLTM